MNATPLEVPVGLPDPLEICLEDLDEPSFVRCVALPGGLPGLALSERGTLLWRSEEAAACELWVSADSRLMLLRPRGASEVVVRRAGRFVSAPFDKPVVLLHGDEVDVAGHRFCVHVHGIAHVIEPPTLLEELTRAARAAAVGGALLLAPALAGCVDEPAPAAHSERPAWMRSAPSSALTSPAPASASPAPASASPAPASPAAAATPDSGSGATPAPTRPPPPIEVRDRLPKPAMPHNHRGLVDEPFTPNQQAEVALVVDPPVAVEWNGKRLGTTPLKTKLPVGRQVLKLLPKGKPPKSITIDVKPGGTQLRYDLDDL